jgi:hypothetical protein
MMITEMSLLMFVNVLKFNDNRIVDGYAGFKRSFWPGIKTPRRNVEK